MPSVDVHDSPLDVLERLFAREHTAEWLSLFDDIAEPAATLFKLRFFDHQRHMLSRGAVPNRFRIERLDDGLRLVYVGRPIDAPDPDVIDAIVASDGRIETFRVNGRAGVDAIVDLGLSGDGLVRAFLAPGTTEVAEIFMISESIWAKPEPKLPPGFRMGMVDYAYNHEFTQTPPQVVLSNGAIIDLRPSDLPMRTQRGHLLAKFDLMLPVEMTSAVEVREIRVSAGDWIVADWPTVEMSWQPNCPLAPLFAAGKDPKVRDGVFVGTMQEYLVQTGGRLLTVPIDGPAGMWTELDSRRLIERCDRLVADTDKAAFALADRVAARDRAEAVMRESFAHIWSDWEVANDRAELVERLVTMTIAMAIKADDKSNPADDYAQAAEAAILLATFNG